MPALHSLELLIVVMAQGLHSIPGSLLNVNTFERFKAAQEQASQHLQKVSAVGKVHKEAQHDLGDNGILTHVTASAYQPVNPADKGSAAAH